MNISYYKIRRVLSALALFALCSAAQVAIAFAFAAAAPFEGRITATVHRGEAETLLYTVATNQMRVERGESDRPYPVDLLNRASGELTLLFPNNRSFVRLQPSAENQFGAPGFPAMPCMTLPTGAILQEQYPAPIPAVVGPANLQGMPPVPRMPPGVGPQSAALGATPALPAMPMMMPPITMGKMELKATTDTTNLLGYPCTRFELKQRGEVMEIWATDKLPPFQPYLQSQPHRFGPQMMERQWGELLKAKKLFPLFAVLRFEPPPAAAGTAPAPPGPERLRFEVNFIMPQKIRDGTLFEPPPDYQEIQSLPF